MRSSSSTIVAAGVVIATALPAFGQDTGHHKMHQTAPIGGKLCMVTHEHYGESPPVASAKAGRIMAINKWQIFTSEEYGKNWGNYAASVGKKEKCVGTAPNMICSVESRPCRPLKAR